MPSCAIRPSNVFPAFAVLVACGHAARTDVVDGGVDSGTTSFLDAGVTLFVDAGTSVPVDAGPPVAVGGEVTNGSPGSSLGFDSSTTTTSTAAIQAGAIGPNGQLMTIATATLDAAGQYSFDVPPSSNVLVIQAVSNGGTVLASTVVNVEGQTNDVVTAPSMTTQSSVEAGVLLEMVAQGAAAGTVDLVGLLERVDASAAEAVKATADSGDSATGEIAALASAEIAAQQAQGQSYGSAAASLNVQTLILAEAQALAAYDAEIEGGTAQIQAQGLLDSAMGGALVAQGIPLTVQGQAEEAASAAFRGALQALLSSSVLDQPLFQATALAEAAIEARQSSTAVTAALTAASVTPSTIGLAETAGTALQAQVSAAATVTVAAQAFATYGATIAGGAQVSEDASIIGEAVGTTASTTVETSLQATLAAATMAQATLDASLAAAFPAGPAVDVAAAAQADATAYAMFQASVQAQAQTDLASATTSSETALVADVMALALGSFQPTAAPSD